MSSWIMLWSMVLFLYLFHTIRSSANSLFFDWLLSINLEIYSVNKRGPMTVPYGRLFLTCFLEDKVSFISTRQECSHNRSSIIDYTRDGKFLLFITSSNFLCLRFLYASVQSNSSAIPNSTSWKVSAMSVSILVMLSIALQPFLKICLGLGYHLIDLYKPF